MQLLLICFSICFSTDSNGAYIKSTKSFIFSFVNRDNLKPFRTNVNIIDNAIYGGGGYMPTFGSGHDIYLCDNAGGSTSSYTNFAHSYSQVKDYVYSADKTKNLLAGSHNFQPSELEVFKQVA